MKKNLNNKIAFIIGVVLLCIYGIIGIPSGFSGAALKQALTNRIHLGLDLQGGVHLILQVKVGEALNAETDNAVQTIQQDLKTASIGFGTVIKPDPATPQLIHVSGVSTAQFSAAKSLLDQKYSNEYDLSGTNADSGLTLKMKPNQILALNDATVQKAIDAIGERVNALGVSEPVVQKYGLGDNQILVELPGISDMDKVIGIVQDTSSKAAAPWLPVPIPKKFMCCSAPRLWPETIFVPSRRARTPIPASAKCSSRSPMKRAKSSTTIPRPTSATTWP
jgi:preprotein translocase subunit SecD